MAAESIRRERAANLVEKCDGGILVILEVGRVPTLGDVDPSDLQFKVDTEMYVIETDSDINTTTES